MSHIERLTLFLDDRDNRSLSSARIKDGLPAADRIRAAVQLWQQGSAVAEQINNRAADLRRERLARNPPVGTPDQGVRDPGRDHPPGPGTCPDRGWHPGSRTRTCRPASVAAGSAVPGRGR